jgi:Methyltransferase domain
MSERNARLLAGLGPADRLIEIGPSFNPVAPRSAGWQVTIVDHASREGLIAKYADTPSVDPAQIEAVDVVWQGGPLDEAVPAEHHGTYAALIACHVIEHLPDVVGFLRSAQALLDPTRGAMLLAVPDKRLCFDFFRPISTTGQFLSAHRTGRRRHSAAAMFDHVAYSASDGGRAGWSRAPLHELRLEHTLEQALQHFEVPDSDGEYRDCHAWQYTPASFELLILELGERGATDWRVEWLEPQPAVEFLVRLQRGRQRFSSAAAREARRFELLKRMVLELREQADCLLGGPALATEPGLGASAPWTDAGPLSGSEARLGAIEARLRRISEAQLPDIAASLGAAQEDLRPVRSALESLLPVRRAIARMRGRG